MTYSTTEMDSISAVVDKIKKKKGSKGRGDASSLHTRRSRGNERSSSKQKGLDEGVKPSDGLSEGKPSDIQKYSEDKDTWSKFEHALESALLKGEKEFTFDNKRFPTQETSTVAKAVTQGTYKSGKEEEVKPDEKKADEKKVEGKVVEGKAKQPEQQQVKK